MVTMQLHDFLFFQKVWNGIYVSLDISPNQRDDLQPALKVQQPSSVESMECFFDLREASILYYYCIM